MFDRLCESGRVHARPPLAPIALSAFANVAVMLGAAVATRPPTPEALAAEATTEVIFLLPLPPRPEPTAAVGVVWADGKQAGAGERAVTDSASGKGVALAGGGGEQGSGRGRRGRKQARDTVSSVQQVPSDFPGGNVYIASELDRPVVFDPTSAAPEYPEPLKQSGIEGYARLRFVVDTMGMADPATIEEVDVTHPLFAVSVRTALQRMHFRPAELGEHRVRQLVEQQFKFVMTVAAQQPPAAAPGTAPGTEAPPPAPDGTTPPPPAPGAAPPGVVPTAAQSAAQSPAVAESASALPGAAPAAATASVPRTTPPGIRPR